MVGVEVTGDGEFHCEALGPDQFSQGVHFGDDEHGPSRRYVSRQACRGRAPRHQTTDSASRILIGPWRTSKAA